MQIMKSKLVFFFFLTISFFLIIGCGEKLTDNLRDKHVIPYVPVNTEINLSYADFAHLKNPGSSQYIQRSYPLGKELGYRANGIIVFNTNGDEYKCWDATCTKCMEADTHLNPEATDAICPTCGIKFSLNYGQPWNSKTEKLYPLKEYPITISGNVLKVRN